MKEDNIPPLRWQLGLIQEVISGGDGVIRVAIAELAVLAIYSNIVGTVTLSIRGSHLALLSSLAKTEHKYTLI